jgi:signal transduction histidine kinase
MAEECGTILVVDDDERNIRLLRAFLEPEGYELSEATNGGDALRIYRESMPDLVLLDIMMPDMDGYEVCRKIRMEETDIHVPVIMVTALEEREERERAAEIGADDFITKPLDKTELLSRVKSLLRIASYQRRLHSKNRELLRINERLEKIQKAREELIHMIIHDLKNPLTGVYGNLELMMMSSDTLSEHQQSLLKKALIACDRIMNMIQNVLDVYKISEGRLTPRLCVLELERLMEDILGNFEMKAEVKGIDIQFDLRHDLTMLTTDPEIFTRIMGNLLSNAIRHSERGGQIRVDVRRMDDMITVSVSDSGPGVPDHLKERIFDRFEQARLEGYQKETGSAGLGLTFCRLAVESMNGRIWVEDNPDGKGSCFIFSLPVMSAEGNPPS